MKCSDLKHKMKNIDWYVDDIDDTEDTLLVCNPDDAVKFLDYDDSLKASIVITEVINPGTVYMIPAQEFLDYLEGGYA